MGAQEGAGAGDLAGFLELGAYAGHHPQSRDEAYSREELRNAFAVHVETLDCPIPGGDGGGQAFGYYVGSGLK